MAAATEGLALHWNQTGCKVLVWMKAEVPVPVSEVIEADLEGLEGLGAGLAFADP